MTPKEKAIELVDKFTIPHYEWDGDGYNINWEETFKNRKHCALIAVDEILHLTSIRESWFNVKGKYEERFVLDQYWVEVKKEIEAL